MASSAWKKSDDAVTQAMVKLAKQPFMTLKLDSVEFMALETFFVAMYDGGEENINELHETIFCRPNQNAELLPPTQNALFHHCQRAIYQASIWVSENVAEINSPDPLEFSWRK